MMLEKSLIFSIALFILAVITFKNVVLVVTSPTIVNVFTLLDVVIVVTVVTIVT